MDLNDPFETRPAWTRIHEERHREEQIYRDSQLRSGPMFACVEGGLVQVDATVVTPEHQPVEIDAQYGLADIHNKEVFRNLHRRFRVLSFSRSLFDPSLRIKKSSEEATLMWSHYGDSFKGAAILFDVEKFPVGVTEAPIEVDYGPERYSLPADFYDRYSSPSEDSDASERETYSAVLKILKSKSPAWFYEDEIRLIYDLCELTEDTGLSTIAMACPECTAASKNRSECKFPEKRQAVKFPPEAVKAVIFGTDMHKDATESILSLVETDYPNCELYWSCIHGSDYAIQYLKTDADYIRSMQKIRTEDYNTIKDHIIYTPDGLALIEAAKGSSIDMDEMVRRLNESQDS